MSRAAEELQALLNRLLPHAERMLSEHGDFYPCAVVLESDGKVDVVAPPIRTETPDAGDVLVALHEDLRAQAAEGSIRASGIAADVTLTDPESGETTDAVQVELDHAESEAVDVYVPYEAEAGGIRFGELVAARGREPVFAPG
jgi:hypothetical protein